MYTVGEETHQHPVTRSSPVQEFKTANNRIFPKTLAIYCLFAVVVALLYSIRELGPGAFLVASVPAWIVIGWGQLALFNALHEGLHMRFGAPHRERLAWLLAGWPVGFSDSYRRLHLDHHRFLGDPQRDPDYVNYAGFPGNRRQFIARCAMNLCGVNSVLQFLGLRQAAAPEAGAADRSRARGLLQIAMIQGLLLLLFHALVGWQYYLWLWLLPLLTFGKFFSFARTFCEHASPGGRVTVRTISGSFLGEKLLGTFCFNYHAEHHEHVFIPCNELERAHRRVAPALYHDRGSDEPLYEHYRGGYAALLWGWFRALPW